MYHGHAGFQIPRTLCTLARVALTSGYVGVASEFLLIAHISIMKAQLPIPPFQYRHQINRPPRSPRYRQALNPQKTSPPSWHGTPRRALQKVLSSGRNTLRFSTGLWHPHGKRYSSAMQLCTYVFMNVLM